MTYFQSICFNGKTDGVHAPRETLAKGPDTVKPRGSVVSCLYLNSLCLVQSAFLDTINICRNSLRQLFLECSQDPLASNHQVVVHVDISNREKVCNLGCSTTLQVVAVSKVAQQPRDSFFSACHHWYSLFIWDPLPLLRLSLVAKAHLALCST